MTDRKPFGKFIETITDESGHLIDVYLDEKNDCREFWADINGHYECIANEFITCFTAVEFCHKYLQEWDLSSLK